MRHKLLKAKTAEDRDILKGKIEAREYMDWLVNGSGADDQVNVIKAYLIRTDFFRKWTDELIETDNEREEIRIIERINEWERIKKRFLKDPNKFLKVWHL